MRNSVSTFPVVDPKQHPFRMLSLKIYFQFIILINTWHKRYNDNAILFFDPCEAAFLLKNENVFPFICLFSLFFWENLFAVYFFNGICVFQYSCTFSDPFVLYSVVCHLLIDLLQNIPICKLFVWIRICLQLCECFVGFALFIWIEVWLDHAKVPFEFNFLICNISNAASQAYV